MGKRGEKGREHGPAPEDEDAPPGDSKDPESDRAFEDACRRYGRLSGRRRR